MAKRSRFNLATSRDVARAANVSQALVSRAFSGKGRIAVETRDRILKVANELGWQPNALAAGMVTGDAPLVAVVTTRLSFEWRAQALSHLLKAFEARQLKPLLFYAESDDEVDSLLRETISWRTRGVIVTAGEIRASSAEAILSRGQFLATLNRPANHPAAFSVATDNLLGGDMAANLLIKEGHKSFLVLAGPNHSWASSVRCEGFLRALGDRGLSASVAHNDAMSIEVGKECAAAYLRLPKKQRPSGIFSTNDSMAIGFMDGLRDRGGEIPDGLSVVGFDNLSASSWTPYQLTTFEQPLDDMVNSVLDHIARHQQGSPLTDASMANVVRRVGDDNVIYFAPKLIVRATTRAQQ
jgi:DNA-binding LacI/PurR family transcriptional regulator